MEQLDTDSEVSRQENALSVLPKTSDIKTVSITEFKKNFEQWCDWVDDLQMPICITRWGKPAFYMLPYEMYEKLNGS